MDGSASSLAQAIGVRVRHERKARRWTLDQLAEAAGVSRRMVVNVEQGTANPSVGTLLRISGALGVGLPSLVEPPAPPILRVTRRGEAPALWTGELGGRGLLVAASASPDVLELWDWTLTPGERRASEAHTEGTKEALQVQEGTVTLEIGAQSVTLEAGDAIAFPGDANHSYANLGSVAARFSLTVFEPGVGSPGSTRTVADGGR